MNRIVSSAVVALAAMAASWATRRWLNTRDERGRTARREPLESWENEGGALAPRHRADEPQVPL
jgi:hypothetical protein